MELKSEMEIIDGWRNSGDQIIVSICCIAYNQEKYIEDALVGFLKQKTNFAYEIILHDDASSDRTLEIMEVYKKRYPNIIKIIAQKENQYSKGVSPLFEYVAPIACGQFLAICEGDDYWVNEAKLQSQVEILLEDETVGICFHSAKIIDYRSGLEFLTKKYKNKYIKLDEIIASGASLMPTASILAKKSLVDDMPEFVKKSKVGDYFLQVCCGINGAVYIDQYWSIYRMYTENSWSKNTHESVVKFTKNTEEMMGYLVQLEAWLSNRNYAVKAINVMKARLLVQHFSLSFKSKNIISIVKVLRFFDFPVVYNFALIMLREVLRLRI